MYKRKEAINIKYRVSLNKFEKVHKFSGKILQYITQKEETNN